MNKKEVAALMKLIINCYQNFDVTEEKVNIWTMVLADTDFNQAQKNLMTHFKTNVYAPTPADIIKYDPDVWVDYEAQRLESQKRFAALALEQRDTPLVSDEQRAEIRRRAEAGEYDEKYRNERIWPDEYS